MTIHSKIEYIMFFVVPSLLSNATMNILEYRMVISVCVCESVFTFEKLDDLTSKKVPLDICQCYKHDLREDIQG